MIAKEIIYSSEHNKCVCVSETDVKIIFDFPVCYELEDLLAFLGDYRVFATDETIFECKYKWGIE